MAKITLLAVAHPWQCDQMGHLNVRFSARMFDDAGYQFLAGVAFTEALPHLGWADVRVHTAFRHETMARTLLTVATDVTGIGKSSIRCGACPDRQPDGVGERRRECRHRALRSDGARIGAAGRCGAGTGRGSCWRMCHVGAVATQQREGVVHMHATSERKRVIQIERAM